jgi:hypothetical protein
MGRVMAPSSRRGHRSQGQVRCKQRDEMPPDRSIRRDLVGPMLICVLPNLRSDSVQFLTFSSFSSLTMLLFQLSLSLLKRLLAQLSIVVTKVRFQISYLESLERLGYPVEGRRGAACSLALRKAGI